jgi:hypothetical protein
MRALDEPANIGKGRSGLSPLGFLEFVVKLKISRYEHCFPALRQGDVKTILDGMAKSKRDFYRFTEQNDA